MFWYEDEVKRLEAEGLKLGYKPETLFYGSSSIRMWDSLYLDFKAQKPINLGFGGSTLAACVWFFDRIMAPYQPKQIVVYAGDNDLGDGRHPEEIFIFFQQLMIKTAARFGNIPCYYISLKPSPARWHMADQFKFTNKIIQNEIINSNNNWRYIDVFDEMLDPKGHPRSEYFVSDGLHLSGQCYQLWKDIVCKNI